MTSVARPSLLRRLRWPLRTTDVYVSRTYFAAYAVSFVSFVGLFVIIEAFAKLDRFVEHGGSLLVTLIRYDLAMIPTVWTNYMGPILTSAAGLVTVTLLNRHNELVPLKASGVSVYRALLPLFFFAAVFLVLTLFLQERVLPGFREPIRLALAISHARPLQPKPNYDAENGYVIKVREYSTTRRVGRDIEVSQSHPSGRAKMRIDSNQIEWVGERPDDDEHGSWYLHHGSIQRWDEHGNLVLNEGSSNFERLKTVFTKMRFETTMRPIDLETSDLDISYLSWRELKTQFQRQPYLRHLAVKLHLHFAAPLAHVVLLLLALPLMLRFQNRSVFVALAVSFAIGAAFYLVSSISMSIATDSNYFSPILAAWLPVMLFGAVGITLCDNVDA
jgi:lipopolysaccharide export system permease protein